MYKMLQLKPLNMQILSLFLIREVRSINLKWLKFTLFIKTTAKRRTRSCTVLSRTRRINTFPKTD